MSSYITIGDYEFDRCHAFKTEKSWKQLVQTAVIKMHNVEEMLKVLKVGDPVEIQAGYDGELGSEFKGYVSRILPKIPVEIHVEDEMWQLRQQTFSGSWQSIKLAALLNLMIPGATLEVPDVNLSPFRIEKGTTKAMVLQKLKDNFLLAAYYRDKTLFVGLPYVEKNLPEVVFHFQQNAKADNLVFTRKEDLRIKVRAVSVQPDNTRFEKEYGDADGDTTTLHFYNKTESEMDALAKEQIGRMKYDGLSGTFKSFGVPYIDHSYTAILYDDLFPQREATVFSDRVVTDYGPDEGFVRTITPGRRVVA